MAYEDYAIEIFHAACACGRGIVRYSKRYLYNDWGHGQVVHTPIEIVCDCCRDQYHIENIDGLTDYLVPNGMYIPQNQPIRFDFIFDLNEETVSRYSKDELLDMLADMKAPKHRFIKQLENHGSRWFADKIVASSGKKSLAPIIRSLQEIIENYDGIFISYEQKQKKKDIYMMEVAKYEKEFRHVMSHSKQLSFALHSTWHSPKHKAALRFRDKYAEEHPEEKLSDLEVDLTFEVDYTNLFWDTYQIIRCTDSQYLYKANGWLSTRNKLTKKYLCRCSLCGQTAEYAAVDFQIKQHFDQAYQPTPCCSCHTVTSFEAKAMKILNANGISYIREKTFDGLVGDAGKLLRFDFALYRQCSPEGVPCIDLIIELQGPHHTIAGYYDEDRDYITDDNSEEGQRKATQQFERQLRYDKRKQEYCSSHGIRLECIEDQSSYACLEKKILTILHDSDYKCMPRADEQIKQQK